MSTVFTAPRSVLDQSLVAANLAVAALALGIAAYSLASGGFEGGLKIPIALAMVTWLFATPLLAGLGGYRARVAGRRRAFLLHSVLGSVWAIGMTAALVLRTLHA